MEDYNDLNHANHDKLPPRSVYHAQAKGNDKNNFKIKLPFIRIFMFIAAILVVTIVSISLFSKDSSPTGGTAQPDEPTPPISNIGQANSDEDEDKDEDEDEDEDEDDTEKEDSSNVVVVKPNITIKPVTPTDQPTTSTDSTNNTNEDSEPEIETPQTNSPTTNPSTTPSTTPTTPETPKVEYVQHVVQKEETLYRIAMNYLKSPDGVEVIKKLNGLKDTTIKEGQILKIPKQ